MNKNRRLFHSSNDGEPLITETSSTTQLAIITIPQEVALQNQLSLNKLFLHLHMKSFFFGGKSFPVALTFRGGFR